MARSRNVPPGAGPAPAGLAGVRCTAGRGSSALHVRDQPSQPARVDCSAVYLCPPSRYGVRSPSRRRSLAPDGRLDRRFPSPTFRPCRTNTAVLGGGVSVDERPRGQDPPARGQRTTGTTHHVRITRGPHGSKGRSRGDDAVGGNHRQQRPRGNHCPSPPWWALPTQGIRHACDSVPSARRTRVDGLLPRLHPLAPGPAEVRPAPPGLHVRAAPSCCPGFRQVSTTDARIERAGCTHRASPTQPQESS
jgi:hypothetical protein